MVAAVSVVNLRSYFGGRVFVSRQSVIRLCGVDLVYKPGREEKQVLDSTENLKQIVFVQPSNGIELNTYAGLPPIFTAHAPLQARSTIA